MQQLIIKPWRSQGLCCRKKIQKHEKYSNIFQKLLKFVTLKSPRIFHVTYKLCSKILSNPRGISVTLEARAA